MDNALYLLAAAMDTSTREHQRIAHNLANVQTTGFKEILSRLEGMNESGVSFPDHQTQTSFRQGILEKTNHRMDIAIKGNGFLVAEGQNGRCYLRSSRLQVDSQGYILTASGHKLIGEDGPIQIDPEKANQLRFDRSGKIWVGDEEVGTLKMVKFANPQKLISQEGVFYNPEKLAEETCQSDIKQGFIEKSSVDPLASMADMISNMRHFGAIQKVSHLMDEGWQSLLRE